LAEASNGKCDGNIYTFNMCKRDSKPKLEHEPKSDQMPTISPTLQSSSANHIRIAPDTTIPRLEPEQV
jgi:hypothetical protein